MPVELRRELGLVAGDPLVVRVEGERLILEKHDAVLRRLRHRFAMVPAGVSLVDELLEERRRDAERDDG